MRRHGIVNGILGVAALSLATEILRTWARELPSPDSGAVSLAVGAAARSPGSNKGEGSGSSIAPTTLVAAIEARDLFDPSRRAPDAGAPAPVPVSGDLEPPGVAVVGLRLLGSDREAVVTDIAAGVGGQQRRVRVGDEIGTYNVKQINATELVIVSSSGREVVMPLLRAQAYASPPPLERAAAVAARGRTAGAGTAGVAARGRAPATAGSRTVGPPQGVAAEAPGQVIALQRPTSTGPAISPARPAAEPMALPDIRGRLERFREPREPLPSRRDRR